MTGPISALDAPAAETGESPFWWPEQGALVWVDIPAGRVHRWRAGHHESWRFDGEVGSIAPLPGGRLLVALRAGIVRFDPADGRCDRLARAPYDTASQRFNDGRADPQGRFWVGTLCEPRDPPLAALYCYARGEIARIADGVANSNGLAWSPDGATLYWSDTSAHRIDALDFDGRTGTVSNRRVFARFAERRPGQPLADYGGRPDGAAVDTDGCYWAAMYEGARLVRIAPDGSVVGEVRLPVRCPTMPCFGGPDLRTLYVTTARQGRPADELEREPLAGRVLQLRVDVPGLPVNFASA